MLKGRAWLAKYFMVDEDLSGRPWVLLDIYDIPIVEEENVVEFDVIFSGKKVITQYSEDHRTLDIIVKLLEEEVIIEKTFADEKYFVIGPGFRKVFTKETVVGY